jgi:hypothetical protein
VLRETDRTTRILFAPNRALRVLRDVIVLPILRSRWVQCRMFGKLSQLHVHYRASSLSRDSRRPFRRGVIHAGDRTPDVAFRHASSGVQTTLFELLKPLRPLVPIGGTHQTDLCERLGHLDIDAYVVHQARTGDSSSAGAGLLDIHGDSATMYGLRGDFLCLIRPDGHVGFVQHSASRAALRPYLDLICDPSQVRRAFM